MKQTWTRQNTIANVWRNLKIVFPPPGSELEIFVHRPVPGLEHFCFSCCRHQGILKGEVSQYHWPPVWLVWNQLYDSKYIVENTLCMTTDNFCFYLQNRRIQASQTGGQRYSDTSPFSIPCRHWLLKSTKSILKTSN